MPAKKIKVKSAGPKSYGSSARTRAVEDAIAGLGHWPLLVATLALHYQLPDLSSKKGLRECNRNIDTIAGDLKDAFDKTTNIRLKGGIVGIWGKLCYDAVIRNKLMQQDILKRIISILERKDTMVISLQTLATITRHGGKESRFEVARAVTPTLVRLLKTHSKGYHEPNLMITIMSHAVASLYFDPEPVYKQYPTIKMHEILPVVHQTLIDNGPAPAMFYHCRHIIMSATRYAHAALEKHSPSVDFIVACLRVSDLLIRASAVKSVLRLHLHRDTESLNREQDFAKHMDAIRNLPNHLQDVINDYGLDSCVLYTSLIGTHDLQAAQTRALEDRDFVGLGISLVQIILNSEYGIAEGYFQDEKGVKRDMDMPYDNFVESLPVAAQAMRDQDPVLFVDMIYMLQLKYHLSRKQFETARVLAEVALQRNSHNPYYYYVMAICEDRRTDVQLRFAKRGLVCQQMQGPGKSLDRGAYLRYTLLEVAATSALEKALELLESTTEKGSEQSVLALALLHSAKEDATTYIEEAPPDSRAMQKVLIILMCSTLVLRGNELSQDLREFKDLQAKHAQAKEFMYHLRNAYGSVPSSPLWTWTYETIMERYERAAKFWDPRLVDCNSHTLQNHPGPGDEYEDAEELRELFSKVAFDENGRPVPRNEEDGTDILNDDWIKGSEDRGNDHEHPPRAHTPVHAHGYGYGCGGGTGGGPNKASIGISYVDDSIIKLYQCNFCGNSSAALKKCGRCGQARYCDASCQKDDWKVHKEICGK